MVQVNRVCLKILFINRPQFLVDSNEMEYIFPYKDNHFINKLQETINEVYAFRIII